MMTMEQSSKLPALQSTEGQHESGQSSLSSSSQSANPRQVIQKFQSGYHPLQLRKEIMQLQGSIGNHAVVQLLASVQKKDIHQSGNTHQIHQIAAAGVQGPGHPLPHFDKIQAAFGSHHDLSQVEAYTGSKAASATKAIGAQAYATGNKIAFAQPNPSLHTAAHEAAHIIQQQAGVHLKGGIGEANDPYEQQANAVADRVVQGKSATELLSTSVEKHQAHRKLQTPSISSTPIQMMLASGKHSKKEPEESNTKKMTSSLSVNLNKTGDTLQNLVAFFGKQTDKLGAFREYLYNPSMYYMSSGTIRMDSAEILRKPRENIVNAEKSLQENTLVLKSDTRRLVETILAREILVNVASDTSNAPEIATKIEQIITQAKGKFNSLLSKVNKFASEEEIFFRLFENPLLLKYQDFLNTSKQFSEKSHQSQFHNAVMQYLYDVEQGLIKDPAHVIRYVLTLVIFVQYMSWAIQDLQELSADSLIEVFGKTKENQISNISNAYSKNPRFANRGRADRDGIRQKESPAINYRGISYPNYPESDTGLLAPFPVFSPANTSIPVTTNYKMTENSKEDGWILTALKRNQPHVNSISGLCLLFSQFRVVLGDDNIRKKFLPDLEVLMAAIIAYYAGGHSLYESIKGFKVGHGAIDKETLYLKWQILCYEHPFISNEVIKSTLSFLTNLVPEDLKITPADVSNIGLEETVESTSDLSNKPLAMVQPPLPIHRPRLGAPQRVPVPTKDPMGSNTATQSAMPPSRIPKFRRTLVKQPSTVDPIGGNKLVQPPQPIATNSVTNRPPLRAPQRVPVTTKDPMGSNTATQSAMPPSRIPKIGRTLIKQPSTVDPIGSTTATQPTQPIIGKASRVPVAPSKGSTTTTQPAQPIIGKASRVPVAPSKGSTTATQPAQPIIGKASRVPVAPSKGSTTTTQPTQPIIGKASRVPVVPSKGSTTTTQPTQPIIGKASRVPVGPPKGSTTTTQPTSSMNLNQLHEDSDNEEETDE